MKGSAIRRVSPVVRVVLTVALAAFTVVIDNCNGKSSGSSTASPPAATASPTIPTVPPTAVEPSTTGSITGTVTLTGPPPAPKLIYMMSEPMCERQHPGGTVVSPEVVVGKDGALANAVIYIKSGLGNYSFSTPTDPVKLSQKGCMYDPHVLAMRVGQTLEVTNDDQTLHNVHAMSKINPTWNKGQAGGQAPIEQTFSHEELAITIQCNIHPWMRSYVFAFKSPYFSVSSKSGKFELKNLPPGTYTIEAWQEKYGTVDQTVTLNAKESKSISFTFDSTLSSGD